MKWKRWSALALCLGLMLAVLSGCSPSPTAVTVGNRKVDASEYAFYLNYNRSHGEEDSGGILYDESALTDAREAAIQQITTNEVVRIKCEELGLTLSDSQKSALDANKKQLIESLGGTAKYLEYLKQSCLTDRAYDKFQENECYYDLLYQYMLQDSESYFTDETLRQYFSEYYATVKYIWIGLVDDSGNSLGRTERQTRLELAKSVAEQAQEPEADFDALMVEYNEDPTMTVGVPVSKLEADSTEYLTTLFDLEENQVSSPIVLSDGVYILKRCPISASYYDENQSDIYQAALDWRFDETLAGWLGDYPVTVSSVVDKIDLNNLRDYIK